jgi:hypothetical protein
MAGVLWFGLGALVLIACMRALVTRGNRLWRRSTEELVMAIEARRQCTAPGHYDVRELQGLPAPVQSYFRAVLREGQPMIACATLAHRGSFNIGVSGDNWRPFCSRQRIVARRPGFVWDGRVQMGPGVAIHVHDAYVGGLGILRATLPGLFTFAERRGEGDELARGELMRFLAEAAWYPTALLPSQGICWETVDVHSAQATLSDGPLRVSLLFRFDVHGLIESVHADARGRTVGRDIVMTPWEGRWSDYVERDGVRVPGAGEVAWITPERRLPYWRGRLESLAFESCSEPRIVRPAPSPAHRTSHGTSGRGA